jgi:hypothetical protein
LVIHETNLNRYRELASLVRWATWFPQDRTRARTPGEFKRRRYIYHVAGNVVGAASGDACRSA